MKRKKIRRVTNRYDKLELELCKKYKVSITTYEGILSVHMASSGRIWMWRVPEPDKDWHVLYHNGWKLDNTRIKESMRALHKAVELMRGPYPNGFKHFYPFKKEQLNELKSYRYLDFKLSQACADAVVERKPMRVEYGNITFIIKIDANNETEAE